MVLVGGCIHMLKLNEKALVEATQPAWEMMQGFQSQQQSVVEVTTALLERIQEKEERIQAMTLLTPELALQQAEIAEANYKAGTPRALEGVPITLKDTFDLAGYVTTRGSRVFKQHHALEHSGVIRRLYDAGAVFLGKTNTAEFGQSATNENKLGLVTGNPWDIKKTPGGSSGGAAASVAAGYAPIALGADGGGSIRIPAAMTGLFGFKPSYGLCLDEGGFRAMSDFACAGPLTNCVADARLFLSVLADREFRRAPEGLKKLRIGYCESLDGQPVDPAIRAAVGKVAMLLSRMGHQVDSIDPSFSGWEQSFGPLVLAEEWRERGHLLTYCESELTDYEQSSLQAAQALMPEQVHDARQKHQEYRVKIAQLFESYDYLLTPTVASPAFTIGERPSHIDGKKVSRLWGAFPFTSPFNVAGVPAAAIPCGVEQGLPLSAQLVGAYQSDEELLNLCEALERELNFQPYRDGV